MAKDFAKDESSCGCFSTLMGESQKKTVDNLKLFLSNGDHEVPGLKDKADTYSALKFTTNGTLDILDSEPQPKDSNREEHRKKTQKAGSEEVLEAEPSDELEGAQKANPPAELKGRQDQVDMEMAEEAEDWKYEEIFLEEEIEKVKDPMRGDEPAKEGAVQEEEIDEEEE